MAPVSPPPTPPTRVGLWSLPAELLVEISQQLPRSSIGHLRLCCKSFNDALVDTRRSAFHSVSIRANPAGLAFLSGLAASSGARHVRHVTLDIFSQTEGDPPLPEAMDLLGLYPTSAGEDDAPAGLDTPLARQLAVAFCRLPALEGASIASGDGFVPLPYNQFDSRESTWRDSVGTWPETSNPHSWRGGSYRHGNGLDVRTATAKFRAVLFALARAHAKGIPVTTLKVRGGSRDGTGVNDLAFSLSTAEYQLVAPLLGQLKTLHVELGSFMENGVEDYQAFNVFIRLCTGLVELGLSCMSTLHSEQGSIGGFRRQIKYSDAVLRLLETPARPLPDLAVLRMHDFAFSPILLAKLLSQWQVPEEVYLGSIALYDGTTTERDDNPGPKPLKPLWDSVLRSVSDAGPVTTRELGLSNLLELHSFNEYDEVFHVHFECGETLGALCATVRADPGAVMLPEPTLLPSGDDFQIDVGVENDGGNVFLRAAGLLKDPMTEAECERERPEKPTIARRRKRAR
ncbi:hypothetical protein Q8F55_008496 [Vanrija albida]|uniref:F-box domain-containing protein n=1 Tax=Vanrija albida TaxID=181172 RepID=A0ABR3PR69_9TREE